MSSQPRTLHTRPTTPLQHDPSLDRPEVTGPESGPESPFPVYLEGWVTRGFGRGSKDLGCPTANLPDCSIDPYATTLQTGVYYGYARVLDPHHPQNSLGFSTSTTSSSSSTPCPHDQVWPMVMSIGWNPFYKNQSRTAEVHILHDYPHDFYGKELRVVMLGFIRPEYNYASMGTFSNVQPTHPFSTDSSETLWAVPKLTRALARSLEALIKDINTDKDVSLRSVSRPTYFPFAQDPFFTRESRLEEPKEDPNKPREKPTN